MVNRVSRLDASPSDFIGSGWAFPLQLNLQGGIEVSTGAQNIEESIMLILRTDLGERVYRPDFGSRLSELTFMPLSTRTLMLIRLYVQEALELWEPRIELEDVRTEPDLGRGRVDIEILYRIKTSRDRRSLVYPFYLQPPEPV